MSNGGTWACRVLSALHHLSPGVCKKKGDQTMSIQLPSAPKKVDPTIQHGAIRRDVNRHGAAAFDLAEDDQERDEFGSMGPVGRDGDSTMLSFVHLGITVEL